MALTRGVLQASKVFKLLDTSQGTSFPTNDLEALHSRFGLEAQNARQRPVLPVPEQENMRQQEWKGAGVGPEN